MAVKSEKDLPESQRTSWLKALSAMELKNYGYAIQLLQLVLKSHPDFLVGRQLARRAGIAKNAGKKSLLGNISSPSFSILKAQGLVKKDPVAAMDEAEKALASDPFSGQLNQLLKDAALAANIPEVAMFALETIVQGNPKDVKTMHELAKLYMAHQQPSKAVDVYGRILEVTPNDLAAVKGGKDAAAATTMQRGGWEREETTYRDLIHNKAEAERLEQQSRVHRSEEMIDNLLGDLSAKYSEDPTNVDVVRRIAELYEQKNDLDNAVMWYQYTASLAPSDFALVRKASELEQQKIDNFIAEAEAYIAANPDAEDLLQRQAELDETKKRRASLMLEEARKRVDRNPTDLHLRYELGEILVNLGEYKDAIPELQKARQNPNARLRAMNLLGRCYSERGMFDLARNTLSTAVSELAGMDATKKEITYNLGIVYQKMGDKEKSIDCMKQIYEVDYSYRDVAERVEGSYSE